MPQDSALLPVLLMVKVWAGGLLHPCCAVKDRLVGVMPMVAPVTLVSWLIGPVKFWAEAE